jgi:hypothetical protein
MLLFVVVLMPSASSQTPSRRDNLVFIFDNLGLWTFIDGVYTQLHDVDPGQIAVADADGNGIDDIACTFGPYLWTFYNNSSWHHEWTDDTCLCVDDTLLAFKVVDPAAQPHYVIEGFYTTFTVAPQTFQPYRLITRRHDALGTVTGHITHPLTSGFDDVILNYTDGIWISSNSLPDLVQIHPLPAQAMAVADFDPPGWAGHNIEDVVISFANGLGTWIYRTNLAWIQVHPLSAVQMAAGDVDGNGVSDLVLDFGPGYGIWIYNNLRTWRLLHPSPSRHIVLADLDGNRVKDIIVDFGPGAGIWVFQNNSRW